MAFTIRLAVATILLFAATNVDSTPIKSSHLSGGLHDILDGRLPRQVIPTHYNLELQPDIYSQNGPPFYFSGIVDIYAYCSETTNKIVLNAVGLDLTEFPRVIFDPNSPITAPSPLVLQYTFDPQAQFLVLDVTNALVSGAWYIIHLEFNGTLRSNGQGLYYDSYVDSQGNTRYLASTQFEEIEARAAFPCFDEPDLKATFNTTVVSHSSSVTISNTQLIDTVARPNGWQANVFATSPIMSTYQVALAVGDFEYVEADWQGITRYPVRIYGRPEVIPYLQFAATWAARIQAWLEEETDIPYPLAKMDHIALPSKRGAMENWGLITYGEDWLCVSPSTTGSAQRLNVASIIAHELAHQWYGNLVTMKWWDDIWLNEGLASHYNYYPLEVLGWNPSQLQQSDIRRGVQQFYDVDQVNTSDPVRKEVPTVFDAGAAFGGSTYPKGGAMIRQLRSILTPSTLKRGLTRYLTRFSYGTATTDDLWAALTEQAAIDGITAPDGSALNVKYVMDPWLNQFGYPLLSVSRNGDGTATVTARQFFSPRGQEATTPSPFNYKWSIPITVVTNATTNWDAPPAFWLLDNQDTAILTGIPDPGDWFMVNNRQLSFFRVEYDTGIRDDIDAQLLLDHNVIPPESRAQFIDDSFILARSLSVPIKTAMDTTLYIVNEFHYNPWRVMLKNFRYLDLLIRGEIWYTNYRLYLVKQLNDLYLNLGWSFSNLETPLQQSLRRDVIINACYYGMADCQDVAASQFNLYRQNPNDNSIVDPNNLPIVLCYGVARGGAAEWTLVFDQYLQRRSSPFRDERWAYLFGLACSFDSTWQDRLLSYIIQGTLINTYDQNQALFYMINSRVGQPVVWSYLQNSWSSVPSNIDKIQALYWLVATWGDYSRSSEFNNFVGLHPPNSEAELNHFRLMDLGINQNIDWYLSNALGLDEWLADNLPRGEVPSLRSEMPISAAVYWDSLSSAEEAI